MSTFQVPVVRIGAMVAHPDADTLDITSVGEYPVIVKRGAFQPGDLAAYIPVDALVPPTEAFAFLTPAGGKPRPERIKARRLRGIFSMGMLHPAPAGLTEGDDAAEALGIVKWEQPESLSVGGDDEAAPERLTLPVYDIENWRAHSKVLVDGELVQITEKIHGCNARYLLRDGRLWVFSRTRCKRESDVSVWWRAARACGLADRLVGAESFAVYGEVYGQVQDLKYGEASVRFRAFDVLDTNTLRYLDVPDFVAFCDARGIERVPVLYEGPYSAEILKSHADGLTVAGGGKHIREGVVVKPLVNRVERSLGRVILKLVSEAYLLRKGGTEHQ